MRKFKDGQGVEWTLEIIIAEIPRLELETGVNILRLEQPIEQDKEKWIDNEGRHLIGFERLGVDLTLVHSLIYSLCVDQVQELGLTPKEFGRRMAKVHQEAYRTFFEELRDFFQLIGRTAAATFVEKQQTITKQMQAAMVELCNKIDTNEIVGEWKKQVASTTGRKSGALQEPSELIPGR